MSCQDCEDFQQSGMTSYFRWKNANIEVRACEKHLTEIFAVLREAQRPKPSKTYPTDPVTGFPSENQDLDEPIRKVKEIASFTVYEFWFGERLVTQVIASSKSEAQAKAIAEAPMLCDRPNENPMERVRAILGSSVKERRLEYDQENPEG